MSSTIEAWIAHVADYTQLRPAVATAPAISCNIPGTLSTTQKRKRKRNDLDSANANLLAPRKAPRSALAAMDPNLVVMPRRLSQQLPPDIKALHFKLHAVKSSMNIIPHQMQDAVKSTDDDLPIYDHFFDSSCSREMSDLIQEFHELTNICQAASRAKALSISEASWNDEVHSRLFREAFRLYSGIRHENVTSARPCQDFLPKHSASGSIMESKLVDYTVHLESAPGSDFETRIARVLDTQPATCQTITQTLYHPVRLRPAAISIETKSGSGNDDDARTQMGIWVSAHFNRQRSLLYSRYGDDAHDIVLPAHLLVVFNVSVMSISYAVARGEEIQIVPGQDIGLPTSLESGYACLAALRHLAAWADGEYRKWVEKYLLGDGNQYDANPMNIKGQDTVTKALEEFHTWIGASWLTSEEKAGNSRTLELLDYACGTGMITKVSTILYFQTPFSILLHPYISQAYGIDASPQMVHTFNARMAEAGLDTTKFSTVVDDLLNDPVRPELLQHSDFDIAVVGLGFHHFDYPSDAAKRLATRLKPGGVLLLIDFMQHTDATGTSSAVKGFEEENMKTIKERAGLVDFAFVLSSATFEMNKEMHRVYIVKKVFFARATKPCGA
ncbi:Putative S-adenosyl-L-methionine-dependent methyltransferase [Septoria linicola]|uniref:S-adenosyl-L-methionine-dependent methyltransferase n=1 Tax=Septoria linicola TaxID=215465 RepID=A0A9Q9B930_9PEZI|nr:Putative S-adenosyl-L-methionine-dependent methyltransferase [Septoria linicola]